jgi:hypothetical protein
MVTKRKPGARRGRLSKEESLKARARDQEVENYAEAVRIAFRIGPQQARFFARMLIEGQAMRAWTLAEGKPQKNGPPKMRGLRKAMPGSVLVNYEAPIDLASYEKRRKRSGIKPQPERVAEIVDLLELSGVLTRLLDRG